MNKYEQQANDFLKSVNASIKMEYLEHRPYFPDDKNSRDIYKVRIRRNLIPTGASWANKGRAQMTFTFGTNLLGDKPTAYAILACLTKYDPGTFEDFCSDYGYDTASRKAERIYKAVCNEWLHVERVFGDCMDELREIQ